MATNIDILFSDELMRFFASLRLRSGKMYRIDRLDVPQEIPPGLSVDQLLEYCGGHILRVNARGRTYVPGEEANKGSSANDRGQPAASPIATFRRRVRAVQTPFDAARLVKAVLVYPYQLVVPTFRRHEKPLHTNACGDFTILDRSQWLALRGYPEFEMFSMHLDSVLCSAAHYAGAQEIVLVDPMRIYHIDHAPGSGYMPDIGEQLLNRRLEEAGIPRLTDDEFVRLVEEMRAKRGPAVFNGADWGLANEDLPETRIGEDQPTAE